MFATGISFFFDLSLESDTAFQITSQYTAVSTKLAGEKESFQRGSLERNGTTAQMNVRPLVQEGARTESTISKK